MLFRSGRARPPSRRREAPLLGPGPSAQARLQEAGHGLGIHLSPRGQEGAPPGAPQEKVRAEPAGPAVGLVQPLGRLARPVLHRARAEAPDQGEVLHGDAEKPEPRPLGGRRAHGPQEEKEEKKNAQKASPHLRPPKPLQAERSSSARALWASPRSSRATASRAPGLRR